MKRYLTYILICLLALMTACYHDGLEVIIPQEDGRIMLKLSAQDSQTRAGDHSYFEALVEHIDVFIANNDDDDSNVDNDLIIHHERIEIGNTANNGIITLQGLGLGDVSGKTIHIFAVANSSKSEDAMSALQGSNVSNLKNQVEEQPLVYLTGTNITGGGMTSPKSFMMWSEKSNIAIESQAIGDKVIDIVLERAVAKMEFHFLRVQEGTKDQYGNDIETNIHGFGYPEIEINDVENVPLKDLKYKADGSYYFNNLPYKSWFATPYYTHATESYRRKTSPIYNAGHFHWENKNDVKVVAYVYSYSWNVNNSEFDNAPRMVVNLPAVVYNSSDRTKGTYLEDNFYEIQLRLPNQAEGENIYIKRNRHYIIKATINAPGSKSSFEPIEITEPTYFTERAWDAVDINIGGEQNPASYLTLNTNTVEMRNIAQDSSTLRFASSSPITVTLQSASYIDKWGATYTLYDYATNKNKWNDPTNEDDEELNGSKIYATATSGLNGTITINSPIPTNDTPRYLTFKVTNIENEEKTFTVVQYPAISITNRQGYFSYRTDFGSYYTNNVSPYRGKAKWNADTQTWSYPNGLLSFWADIIFESKVAEREGDVYKIYPYYWVNTYIFGYQMMRWKDWSSSDRDFASETLDNARIYHVTINATGITNIDGTKAYTIGRPRMNSNGYTDSGPSNANLVSPSFMIASQLGETQAITDAEAARQHCKVYAEVYLNEYGQEVHLTGWRLPTEAEIKIIAERQGIANAAVDKVLVGQYYHSASGAVPINDYISSGTYIRCIRDHYAPASSTMSE